MFIRACFVVTLVCTLPAAAQAQAPILPPDVGALRLALVQFRTADSLTLSVPPMAAAPVLRAPAGAHVLIAILKGTVSQPQEVGVSGVGVVAYHSAGAVTPRALAVSQGSDSLVWSGGARGSSVTIQRRLQPGPVTIGLAFVVPNSVSAAEIVVPTRVPTLHPLTTRP